MLDLPPIAVIMLVLIVAFALVMTLTLLRLPTIPAYFVAGIGVGPSGLGALHDNETAHFIAELGIIFLLFTIGLKFSLRSLHTIRHYVFGLGGAQTVITALLFGVPMWLFSGEIMLSLLVGSVAAMSSTAIVSQTLIDDNMLVSPVGNRAMGVLLFQDLAVIPLIIIFSAGIGAASVLQTTAIVGAKVAAIMVLVLFAGAPLMSRWLNFVANYGNKELYMLNLIMLIGVLSGMSAWAGLSYALGAFIAGILMSETLHRYRVLRMVEPFRHIFLGFFFISLGVVVDTEYVFNNWLPVLGAAAALIIIKCPLVYLCARMMGTHSKTSFYTAVLLCGAGEFGFVLLTLARDTALIENNVFQFLLSANLLALIAVPMMWEWRQRVTKKLAGLGWFQDVAKSADAGSSIDLSGHVIIAGFGRTGQAIAGILRDIPLSYVALEEDYQIFRTVGGADNIIYAEASSVDGLVNGNIAAAKVLVVSYIDVLNSKATVQRARALNKDLLIMARADTVGLANELLAVGADHAYVDAHEFGFTAAKQLAIDSYRLKSDVLNHAIIRARKRENLFFIGEFGDTETDDGRSASDVFIGCVVQEDISVLEKHLHGCRVISWMRDGKVITPIDITQTARTGDELVLCGNIAALREAKNAIEMVD